ncbi:tripartite motif-containing protein 43-like [Nannospalax galili]|uniref:tripartite motif-containing protein 43-like n=1 Tax=Nannospalax galili TaxID=1026970 RepID=UPI00081A010A|nr:tripartite motif-containing protein 43-like [Nannospalax galili]
MESDISQAFQEELTCFICLNYLTGPVTISCGHSFCRHCLCLSWENIQPPVHCPVCKEPSQQKDLRTDHLLKELVSISRQASLRKCLSSEENLCVTHKETKRIFCQEDRLLLCQLCSNSEEHEGHTLCPTEAAVEKQREKLLEQMTCLWEKIQENQRHLNEEKKIILAWMGYVPLREVLVRTEYRKLHPVILEEEMQHVESLKNEGQSILEKLQKSTAIMVRKRNQLRETYQELAARCQGTHMELLQDLREILTRSESVQQSMPQPMKLALSAQPITGLVHRSNHFRVEIFFENEIMIHYKMNLFNEVRRFSFPHQLQDASVNSDGCYSVFWGTQSFSYGKHYWELFVCDSWDWAIGVCKDSQLTKCGPLIELKDVFLLVFVKEGDYYSLLTTSPSLLHYVEIPLGQIGVLLDCDLGSVSFLNVAKNSLIWKYPTGAFNFPVRPFFSIGHA